MSDRTSLAGESAAMNINDNIKFIGSACSFKGLTNDNLQCFKTEVVIDASFINGNITCSRYKIYSGNTFLSSSGSVIFYISHGYSLLPNLTLISI